MLADVFHGDAKRDFVEVMGLWALWIKKRPRRRSHARLSTRRAAGGIPPDACCQQAGYISAAAQLRSTPRHIRQSSGLQFRLS
jgi:hypothetical protein